jgi:predicted Zn-dependent protease
MQSRLPLGAPQAVNVVPGLTHAMLTARARVLSNPGADAQRGWLSQADEAGLASQATAQQAGTLYGAAMAASRMREVAQARKQFARLQQVVRGDPEAIRQVQWLGIEIELAARDQSRAQVVALGGDVGLDPARPVTALRRPDLVLQAQIAMQGGQAPLLNQVAQNLHNWLVREPHDALVWRWLASLHEAQHQGLRALRAQAESQVAQLDYAGALDRLKAAQDQLRSLGASASRADHIDASIIDTRRRQIEALLKEQTQEP